MTHPHRVSGGRALPVAAALCAAFAGLLALPAQASSHREAPFITTQPKVDATDLYLFASYEPGRDGFVTLIANYLPLQDPYGGPNYFQLDPNALYEIHIDNDGDAKEDLTFQFRFNNTLKGVTLPIGDRNVAIPLIQSGPVGEVRSPSLNVAESYTVDVVRGSRRGARRESITNAANGSEVFDKPVDNIGTKTIPDYAAYADKHIYTVNIPGCGTPGRLFVGQRQDPFAVNLGTIFDLVNAPVAVITDPALINAVPNTIGDKNITTMALEVHSDCLLSERFTEPVIGAWTTASLPRHSVLDPTPKRGLQTTATVRGALTQVSRLGMPLVNELVIGLPDKDRFNGSMPRDDGQFADYVTHPTLPALLEIVLNLPGTAPKNLPRTDLVTTFLLGIKGLNQPANVKASEMLRLNTDVAPTPEATQARLGVAGGDNAGFPNGRRPKDDIVDISLVAVMGGLCVLNGDANALDLGADCKPANVPLGTTALQLHDAVDQAVVPLLPAFPYLNTPLPGAQ
jgi:hypothetical protein